MALVPRSHQRGNRTQRKEELSGKLLQQAIDEHYLTLTAPSVRDTHNFYLELADEHHLPKNSRYSYRALARRIRRIPLQERERARKGRRAAEQVSNPSCSISPLGSPKGSGSWGEAHIDHTLADIYLRRPETDTKERPYVSKMVDSYDGRILAYYIWFGRPSSKIVIRLIQECLRVHGVVPVSFKVDWGSEFRSTRLQKALARIGVNLKYRRKGFPKDGSPIENVFGVMARSMVWNMEGNNKLLKVPRQLTRGDDPRDNAPWTIDGFRAACNELVTYRNTTPRAHGKAPEVIAQEFVDKYGTHFASWFGPELVERLEYMPAPGKKQTRTVSAKAMLRIGSVDYTCDELTELVGQEVTVYVSECDPRKAAFDHPTKPQFVRCRACTTDVLYAQTLEEAADVVEARRTSARLNTAIIAEKGKALSKKIRQIQREQVAALNHGAAPKVITENDDLTVEEIAQINAANF